MKDMLIVQIVLLTRKSEAKKKKKKNGEWRLVVESDCGLVPTDRVASNNYSKDATIVRDSFGKYFNILIQMKVRFHGNGICSAG